MKDKVRRVFQSHTFRERSLKNDAIFFQLFHGRSLAFFPENAHVGMRVFQVGRYVHLVQRHERAVEIDLARDDGAELAFQELVNAK